MLRRTWRERLPALVDGAVWKEVTKGQAGIRWDKEVEKIWKGVIGEEDESTAYR